MAKSLFHQATSQLNRRPSLLTQNSLEMEIFGARLDSQGEPGPAPEKIDSRNVTMPTTTAAAPIDCVVVAFCQKIRSFAPLRKTRLEKVDHKEGLKSAPSTTFTEKVFATAKLDLNLNFSWILEPTKASF